ncbi:MAG: FliH/SctL family protein [Thermoguttaceae bacterium]|jgi:flagellar assembly protein FliH
MSGIIKATDNNLGVQCVTFNLDDMAVRAEQYVQQCLTQLRSEATKTVTKAKQESEAIRKQAEAEGRKAGQAAGEAAIEQIVEKQLSKQLATLLPALRQVVEDIRHAKQAWLTHWEKNAVHLAAAIAARVIRRELAAQPEIPLALVREALELAAGNSQVRVHMNPADHAALGSQVQSLIKEITPLAPAELLADPQITPGGCRVDTQFGSIDQQLETQLARIEEELT